jgi:putative addiction module CopG family antidote
LDIEFAKADEHYIKNSVKNGYYTTEEEAVRDAVRRAREQEDSKYDRLMSALEVGEKAIIEGRVTPYTPELLAKIESDARKHAAEGRKLDPDVCG